MTTARELAAKIGKARAVLARVQPKTKARRRIVSLALHELSLVDRPAVPHGSSRGNVLLTKRHGNEITTALVRVLKSDSSQRYVLAAALVPDVVDAQGDVMDADVIADAAHTFMEKRVVGLQHKGLLGTEQARIVDSFVTPEDLTINGAHVAAGTWLVGLKLGSDLFASVKAGKLLGVSIGGMSSTEPLT